MSIGYKIRRSKWFKNSPQYCVQSSWGTTLHEHSPMEIPNHNRSWTQRTLHPLNKCYCHRYRSMVRQNLLGRYFLPAESRMWRRGSNWWSTMDCRICDTGCWWSMSNWLCTKYQVAVPCCLSARNRRPSPIRLKLMRIWVVQLRPVFVELRYQYQPSCLCLREAELLGISWRRWVPRATSLKPHRCATMRDCSLHGRFAGTSIRNRSSIAYSHFPCSPGFDQCSQHNGLPLKSTHLVSMIHRTDRHRCCCSGRTPRRLEKGFHLLPLEFPG